MVERRSRVARGKEFLKKNISKLYPEVPEIKRKGGKVVAKAKKGSKVKKAMNGMTTTLAQRSARAARPAVSPESGRRKTRASLAMNPMMKTGGKTKKMMGGGKCRGGCY
jgi:hypothetical protein